MKISQLFFSRKRMDSRLDNEAPRLEQKINNQFAFVRIDNFAKGLIINKHLKK